MKKHRSFLLFTVTALVAFGALFHSGCTKEPEEPEQLFVTLHIVPTLPEEIDALNVDSLWVIVENTRTGKRDSAVSRYCQTVEMRLEKGNYNVHALGRLITERTIIQYAGVELNRPLTEERQKIALAITLSTVHNPDFVEKVGEVPLTVRITRPAEMQTLSVENIDVIVTNLTDGVQQQKKTNARGEAHFLLVKGKYSVEAREVKTDAVTGKHKVSIAQFNEIDLTKENPVSAISSEITEFNEVKKGEGELHIKLERTGDEGIAFRNGYELTLRDLISNKEYRIKTDQTGTVASLLPYSTYEVSPGTIFIPDESRVWQHGYSFARTQIAHEERSGTHTIPLEFSERISSLLIKEIYFSASKSAATGERYGADKYFEIYNNSADTVFADGVSMCATYANTMLKKGSNIFPEFIGTDEIVPGFIFTVPGSGKEHPIAPGKTLLIADQALNHRAINPGSPVDLSQADFEWYDEDWRDVDVPEVPNMEKWFSYSRTVTTLHVRGYWGFFIMKGDAPMEEFLAARRRKSTHGNGSTASIYAIHKDYILDAVQCADPKGPRCNVFPASLDAGYTYCSEVHNAKCVKRKVAGRSADGRYILQDTNNSSDDFIPDAPPSPRIVTQ